MKEIDGFVGTRQRSSFLTQAAERELMRLRQLKALDDGAWKDSDHTELKQGSAKWVRNLRQQQPIGAVAIHYRLPLITDNVEDFPMHEL